MNDTGDNPFPVKFSHKHPFFAKRNWRRAKAYWELKKYKCFFRYVILGRYTWGDLRFVSKYPEFNWECSFPNLIASDLVDVQPMTGPSCVVFHMNIVYEPNKGEVKDGN